MKDVLSNGETELRTLSVRFPPRVSNYQLGFAESCDSYRNMIAQQFLENVN